MVVKTVILRSEHSVLLAGRYAELWVSECKYSLKPFDFGPNIGNLYSRNRELSTWKIGLTSAGYYYLPAG